jgi:hypothetical protein
MIAAIVVLIVAVVTATKIMSIQVSVFLAPQVLIDTDCKFNTDTIRYKFCNCKSKRIIRISRYPIYFYSPIHSIIFIVSSSQVPDGNKYQVCVSSSIVSAIVSTCQFFNHGSGDETVTMNIPG